MLTQNLLGKVHSDNIVTELAGIRLGQVNILPAAPHSTTDQMACPMDWLPVLQ